MKLGSRKVWSTVIVFYRLDVKADVQSLMNYLEDDELTH